MATQVFISWSGDLSRQLAEALYNWLPGVLQYVKPYFSPDDVEKGAKIVSEYLGDVRRKFSKDPSLTYTARHQCLMAGKTFVSEKVCEANKLPENFITIGPAQECM